MSDLNLNVNVSEVDGSFFLPKGDTTHVFPTRLHRIGETLPFPAPAASGADSDRSGAPLRVVAPFLSLMLDKRAPGMFTSAYAGPAAKLEWLAEMMVTSGTTAQVARELMSHDLISRVNERILRSNSRFKSGTVIMSYPMLFGTMLDIVGASSNTSDPKRVVARVLTELLARVYSEFGVMMPYKTFYSQKYYSEVVADTSAIIDAAYVATVTETLEVMRLGSAMKAKEFSAAVVESVLGPTLLNAANKLLAAERYNRWMNDAAIITGAYLTGSDPSTVEPLLDDGNLQVLASNASWALGAASMSASRSVVSPVHEHTELLGYAALRLRELRRYETVSLEKFKAMYTIKVLKTAKGKLAGAFVARNADIMAHTKAATLHEDAGVVMPMPSIALDPYMPMLNELANAAFASDVTRNAAYVFASHMIGRRAEIDDEHNVLAFCVTDREIRMLALAMAGQVLLSTVGLQATVYYGLLDGRVNYEGGAYYDGEYAWTDDAYEIFLLNGEDFEGSQRFMTKPQTYEEAMFTGILDQIDSELYSAATRQITIHLPALDGSLFKTSMSLYNLVTGEAVEPVLKQFVALDRQLMEYVGSMYAVGMWAHQDLAARSSPVDELMAEQIAIGIHDVTARFVKPVGFSRFMKTVQAFMIANSSLTTRDARMLMANVTTKHALAIRLAGALMVRLGVVPFGLQDDIINLLSNAKAVERAATADAFNATLTAGLRA